MKNGGRKIPVPDVEDMFRGTGDEDQGIVRVPHYLVYRGYMAVIGSQKVRGIFCCRER